MWNCRCLWESQLRKLGDAARAHVPVHDVVAPQAIGFHGPLAPDLPCRHAELLLPPTSYLLPPATCYLLPDPGCRWDAVMRDTK